MAFRTGSLGRVANNKYCNDRENRRMRISKKQGAQVYLLLQWLRTRRGVSCSREYIAAFFNIIC